jgi:hypothetical protein
VTVAPPLPRLDRILGRTRREALDALAAAGWRAWATPIGLDAELRRRLNLDLGDPDLSFAAGDALAAVVRLEADRQGRVTHLEVVATEPAAPVALAAQLLRDPGEPRTAGGADAREWVWGPESGLHEAIGGEPVRLWICAERAYGDRLWMVASLVRRG